jgi:hypothetical protein
VQFGLQWQDRRTRRAQTPRRFLDYVIDGESLYERHGGNLISCLGWSEDEQAAARLLRDEPPDLGDRVAVYICPECWQLDCGAMTVRIERDGQEIDWAAPAMTWREGDEWRHDYDAFADWPELRFDAREYVRAISSRTPVDAGFTP